LFADLHRLLWGEPVASGEVGDRPEVVVQSTRQAPLEHAHRGVADTLEAVHYIARDEDDGARAGRRGLVTDGQLTGTLEDEEHFLLVEMDVVGRAFTGFEVPQDDRDGAAGGLGGEEDFRVD